MSYNIRAQVVLQGGTALPEDQFVNTFHFVDGSGTYVGVPERVAGLLDNFYNDTTAATGMSAQTHAVSAYLSQYVKRTPVTEVKVYNLADGKPRVPNIQSFTLASAYAATSLPEEAALCTSYAAAPPVTGRKRGRLFIGPLVGSALVSATTSVPSTANSGFVTDLANATKRLVEEGSSVSCIWSVYSVAGGGSMYPIVSGWVDNQLDTQRRRGGKSTSRTVWSI